MDSIDRKSEARRRAQAIFAGIVRENNIPPGVFPSSMLPPGFYEWDRLREDPQPQPSSPPRKSRKDPDVAKRREFIRSLGRVTEAKYCEMMAARYTTPESWQAWGCPESYEDAWNLIDNDLRDQFVVVMRSERNNARRAKNPRA